MSRPTLKQTTKLIEILGLQDNQDFADFVDIEHRRARGEGVRISDDDVKRFDVFNVDRHLDDLQLEQARRASITQDVLDSMTNLEDPFYTKGNVHLFALATRHAEALANDKGEQKSAGQGRL